MDIDITVPQPTGPFPYSMRTVEIMEHSRGVAWTADLLREGIKIGSVEQTGVGGADSVILQTPEDKETWQAHVNSAFGGDEEAATWWLMEQEI